MPGFFIGAKKSFCPLCMECKELLILKGGISACRGCLDISTGVLKAAEEKLTTKDEIDRSFGGLAIGFATQAILSHVVAGLFLLVSRLFKHGDTVTISGKTGVVKEITIMDAILEKGEDEILIPSGSLVTQTTQKQI